MRRIAFLAALLLAVPALADEPKDSFKKIEKGAGQLLEGMGQEIRKAESAVRKGAKKDEKKADKPKDGAR